MNAETVKSLDNAREEVLHEMIEAVKESRWRQNYHIQPVMGSIDALSGFLYDGRQYHLYYEWLPFGEEGERYLYHLTSEDLAHFRNEGVIKHLKDGALPGSAFLNGDRIHMYHTAKESETLQKHTTFLPDDSWISNSRTIIKGVPEGYCLMKNPDVKKRDEGYIMTLGAQNRDEYGRALLFRGDSPTEFEYAGEITTDLEQFGFVWEHPSLIRMEGEDLMMFCPKGLDKYRNSYWNIYQSGYVMGRFDFETLKMAHGEFHEFDHGFDFYAPKTAEDDSGPLMIGWMGMEETGYPTDPDHWAHCLTLPRALSIEDGKLKQRPAPALRKMREEGMTAQGYIDHHPRKMKDFYGDSYELVMDFLENEATRIHIDLRVSRREQTSLIYDRETRAFTLDTSFSGQSPDNVDGTTRKVVLEQELGTLSIFVDVSSIEIFINDGEAVMTSRIFPSEKSIGVELSTEIGSCRVEMTRYGMKPLNPEPVLYKR